MDILRTWLKSSSPMVKVLMAISITSGVVVVHKLYYRPYVQKKRHLQAEEWANMILEREEAMRETTEAQ